MIYKSAVKAVLIYGSESWVNTYSMVKFLETEDNREDGTAHWGGGIGVPSRGGGLGDGGTVAHAGVIQEATGHSLVVHHHMINL